MNVRRSLMINLALAALAPCLTGRQAAAQEPALKGTFELPATAYWGNTLLQPGHYTIQVTRYLESVTTFRLTGEGIDRTLLGVSTPARESKRNYLEIANIDGTYAVRTFDAGMLGKSFGFGVSKGVKNKALRASAEPITTVGVSMGGF